jgi:hypothetical protein
LQTKLDPKAKKCVFIGYSLEQKGYRCYNPATHKLRVSRDVVFDEMSSWYAAETVIGGDVSESVVAHDVSQQSQTLSGPGESSSGAKSDNRPWSGRTRSQTNFVGTENVSRNGKAKVNEGLVLPDISVGHFVVDGESSGSDMSLDDELGIPSMKTPGVKKALEGMHTKLRRSFRAKKPVQRYNGYVAHHYAYMAKVVEAVEPTCFEEAVGNVH